MRTVREVAQLLGFSDPISVAEMAQLLGIVKPFSLMHLLQIARPLAEWTVMVFLNADNNLEPFGLKDFGEMAQERLELSLPFKEALTLRWHRRPTSCPVLQGFMRYQAQEY